VRSRFVVATLASLLALSACGGGSSKTASSSPAASGPQPAPVLEVDVGELDTFLAQIDTELSGLDADMTAKEEPVNP
jgi:hypothetical protein